MKVIEFVDGYKKTTDNLKDRYLKEKLEIKNYISFADKCSLAERIVRATAYEKDENGKDTGNIKINSISRYLLFTLSVIDIYTNIDIDFGDIINEYDLLKSSGLLELFIGSDKQLIAQNEYLELQALLNMTLDDAVQNSMSTQAFIQNQVTRFGTLLGVTLSPILEKISENLNNMDEKTIEKLGLQFEKFASKLNK